MPDPAVDAYIQAIPAQRAERFARLHELILSLYPEAEVDMRYRMPSYRLGDGWVALANQKHYLSLYTCASAHIAEFKASHSDIKTGKGCINFRDRDPLPLEDITKVVRHAIERGKGGRARHCRMAAQKSARFCSDSSGLTRKRV